MSKSPDFVYITYIRTTPEQLWAALTRSEFTRQYWSTRIESTWVVGDPISLWHPLDLASARERGMQANDAGEALSDIGTVLVYDPYTTLAYTWATQWDADVRATPPSRVTFSLQPAGETVKLTVTHDELFYRAEMIENFKQGWPALMSGLKSLLETGSALVIEMNAPDPAEAAR